MKQRTLEDLFVEELRDLYNAEKQLFKALPRMARAASSDELREAFEEHLDETKVHVERLEKVADLLEVKPKGKVCKAMEGLVEEGKEVIEEDMEPAVKDAALISAAQRVEHYEMAGYGCLRTWARQLGYTRALKLLEETLGEEKAADAKLTDLAESSINLAAEAGD